jgi:hypothetical protein
VEASRKAREGMSPAPFVKSARVVASAAKLQELETNPKKVPKAILLGPASPMLRFIRSRVTKTWIMELIRYPSPKAQKAIQNRPRLVMAASL